MRTTLSTLLCLLAAPAALRAQRSTEALIKPTVFTEPGWRRDNTPPGRSIVLRRGVDTSIVIRVGHGDGRSAREWFQRGLRRASSAGAIRLRGPVKRKIGTRHWYEAQFRRATQDRTGTVTTVQSVTSYGPCVLEAYLRAPTRAIDRLLADFDRVRRRLRGGALAASSLTPASRNDIEGLWVLEAATMMKEPESYRFASDGSLERHDATRLTRMSYAMSSTGILMISTPDGTKRDSHSCFRVTRPLPAARIERGDLLIVRHTPADRPIDVRVLRDPG